MTSTWWRQRELTEDPCKVLGVDSAILSEPGLTSARLQTWKEGPVRTAWKTAAKEHHPDRGGTEEAFVRMGEAYQAILAVEVWELRGGRPRPAEAEARRWTHEDAAHAFGSFWELWQGAQERAAERRAAEREEARARAVRAARAKREQRRRAKAEARAARAARESVPEPEMAEGYDGPVRSVQVAPDAVEALERVKGIRPRSGSKSEKSITFFLVDVVKATPEGRRTLKEKDKLTKKVKRLFR